MVVQKIASCHLEKWKNKGRAPLQSKLFLDTINNISSIGANRNATYERAFSRRDGSVERSIETEAKTARPTKPTLKSVAF